MATKWKRLLVLDSNEERVEGSEEALCEAIRRGADLRVGTEFRHNEHIDVTSDSNELIREFVDFRETYLVEDRWAAGICTLRMPVALPDGFGPRESMSFFLYNQNGRQAIARPFLDGAPASGPTGPSPVNPHDEMPGYDELSSFDENSNAPSSNFIYHFGTYRYTVCERWREVLAHDKDGEVLSGSLEALTEAFSAGSEVKVGIGGLCSDLSREPDPPRHEVFIHCGSCYFYTETKLFIAAAHPSVRIAPAIPLQYASSNWDFCWLLPQSDGKVARWICDPYTLNFSKSETRHAMRWFVNEG